MPRRIEVVIGGWNTTNSRFRSLLAGANRGGHFVYIGRVRTGYEESKVCNLLPRLRAVTTTRSPFERFLIRSVRAKPGMTIAMPNAHWSGRSSGSAKCSRRENHGKVGVAKGISESDGTSHPNKQTNHIRASSRHFPYGGEVLRGASSHRRPLAI
jgi:hypothetical protein